MSVAIENRFRSVEKLVIISNQKGLDPEVAAYHAKLGAVMVCGAIERCMEIIISDRLCGRSAPQFTEFMKRFFKRGTNYDCDAIEELLFRFDSDWGHRFRDFRTSNSKIIESVSSCYAIRNSVAHGGVQGVGPRALKQYFEDSFTLIVEVQAMVR